MNSLAMTLALGVVPAPGRAAPALRQPTLHTAPARPQRRHGIDGWMSQWYGPLPTVCETPAFASEDAPFSDIAHELCEAAASAPAPEPSRPRTLLPSRRAGETADAEVRAAFAYEPPSWLVVYRIAAEGEARHELEFWPADPRALPGSPAHGPFIVVSRWLPDGERTRGLSLRMSLDGMLEPLAWAVDLNGGAHVAASRAELEAELAFWANQR